MGCGHTGASQGPGLVPNWIHRPVREYANSSGDALQPAGASVSASTQRPPAASTSGYADRTSLRRSGTNKSTYRGKSAARSDGELMGMSVPGMRRDCLAGDASATEGRSERSMPARVSTATAREAAPYPRTRSPDSRAVVSQSRSRTESDSTRRWSLPTMLASRMPACASRASSASTDRSALDGPSASRPAASRTVPP